MIADFVDGVDVGVVERGSGPRLTAEPLERLRVVSHLVGQKLESDEAAEVCILRL